MQLSGCESNDDEWPHLRLTQVQIQATPEELSHFADFLRDMASKIERFGSAFDHEHLQDYCKQRAILRPLNSADIIVCRMTTEALAIEAPIRGPVPFVPATSGSGSSGVKTPICALLMAGRAIEMGPRPIRADEFLSQWAACDRCSDFVRYPSELLATFGVDAENQRFLTDCGLPKWTAPSMHFFFRGGDRLPAPLDSDYVPLKDAPVRLGMVGSTAEDWPICLDPTRPGQFVCFSNDPDCPIRLLNSSARQLAASLLAFYQTTVAALEYGTAHGIDDAWRKRQYPTELDQELYDCLRSIDPDALAPEGYWSWHFLHPDPPTGN